MTPHAVALYTVLLLFPASLAARQAEAERDESPPAAITTLEHVQESMLARFFLDFGRDWIIEWSNDGRRVRSLVGVAAADADIEPSAAAVWFLRETASLLGLDGELTDLKLVEERESLGGRHLSYQQIHEGLPVENGWVQVNLDSTGQVVSVFNTHSPFPALEQEAFIDRERAVEVAIDEYLRTTPRSRSKYDPPDAPFDPVLVGELELAEDPQVEDVYFADDGLLRRSYKIRIHGSVPRGLKEFVIDAATGTVLRRLDYLYSAKDGSGRVFVPNPVNSQNDNSLDDGNDANAQVPNGAYANRTLLNLAGPAAGKYSLKGPFVVLEDIQQPTNSPPTDAAATFNFQRDANDFEAVVAYYHVDRVQRYIQSLGFSNINNRQIRVDPHGEGNDDNSYYNPTPQGSGFLTFGDGGVDDAEDADVIIHEYGHSIHDNQAPGKYPANGQAGAMGEAFGDYLAVSTSWTETTASGHTVPCFAEWDAAASNDACESNPACNVAANPPCLRRIDRNRTMAGLTGSVHQNGEIWSRALWDMLNQIGRTTTDRVVLQSHFNVTKTPSMRDGALAVLSADLQLFQGSHLNAICQIFRNRGILTAADCPQTPSPTGTQDTLVVLVEFSDQGLPDDPLTYAEVNKIVNGLNAYLKGVAYGGPTLKATVKGWYELGNTRDHYYDKTKANLLIELVDDVIALIHKKEPKFDFKILERMIVLTNDDGSGNETRGQKEWATTGPWPYELPKALGAKRLSVSVHRYDHTEAQLTHALGHHFGLIDLYAHEGVTFPRKYADGWGNMAKDKGKFTNVHFLGSSKVRPSWLGGDDLTFIDRPDPGQSHQQTYKLWRQETDGANQRELLQIGTTPELGANDRVQERVSYFVEARKKAGTYDGNLPADGVLVYYLNEDIAQGFGPLRLVDATPADNDLTNAALTVGKKLTNIDGSGLNLEVLAAEAGGSEDYRIKVDYAPPQTDVDVWIRQRDSHWRTPDVWVDSPACTSGVCGFDKDKGRTETDRDEKPKAGVTNRVYARIHNRGPGTAHAIRVDFYISDPSHGIDGGGVDPDTGASTAFNKHYFKTIPVLAKGKDVPVYIEWKPDPKGSRACIKVKIQKVVNDTNDFNQVTQENITAYDTTKSSPYTPVVHSFRVANPYKKAILVYLRADNVPAGWDAELMPEKKYLSVGGSFDAKATIRAPKAYRVCSSELIDITAWYPSGDTLIELGGTTAQINLKKSAKLKAKTTYGPCVDGEDYPFEPPPGGEICSVITSSGCTDPPLPNQHVYLEYTGPDGETIYRDILTDANGCYEDFLVNPRPGDWGVQAIYPGDDCNGPDAPPVVKIHAGENWCCLDGAVSLMLIQECREKGGVPFERLEDAERHCRRPVWCCARERVFEANAAECREHGGTAHASREEAERYCFGEVWCCLDEEVFEAPEPECLGRGGSAHADPDQAERYCFGEIFCCLDGELFGAPAAECRERGGTAYVEPDEAERRCRETRP